jgi:branched-chain amino acid transport system substrate-binding protein
MNVALTGSFAASGKDLQAGVQMYLAEINYTAGGRKIELITEDTQGDPSNALAKARKLVEQDKVNAIIGPTLADEGYAVRDYIDSAKVPDLFAVVSGDDITQRKQSAWIIRTGWTSSQPMHPFGKWAFDQGYKKIAVIAYDYAFGWETVGGFQKAYETAGGQVVQKIWHPTGTKDFAPYLAQLRPDVDALFIQESGADAIRILQQWQEFGMKNKIPVIGGGTLTDESVLKSMGDETLGLITALHWSAALDRPEAKKFVDAFTAKYGYAPGYRAESGYVSAAVIAQALEKTKGNPDNSPQVLVDAIRSVSLANAPRGPVSFDKYGGVVQNIYIRKVEKVGGVLQNTVIATIPNVSQFWTWDPASYMKDPVYSRDYPSCRYCQ